MAPLRTVDRQPVYHSDTLRVFRMLDEGGNVHTLQTWDEERQAWLDPMRVRDLETEEARRGAETARRGVEEAKRLAVQETIGAYIDKLTSPTTDLVRGSQGSPTGSPLAAQ